MLVFAQEVMCFLLQNTKYWTEHSCTVGTLVRRLAICATREISRGFHRFPETNQVLNWHNIPIYSILKQLRFMDNKYSNKAVVTLLITFICMFILIYLSLPEESQSCPRPHIPPTSENLRIFINLCTCGYVWCKFHDWYHFAL